MSAPVLEARGVALRFGGVQAADGVDVQIQARELFFIIGQNGAGKSTFLNLCTGYLRPQRGEILFQGRPITGLAPRAITRAGIARAFQHPQLFGQRSVGDNVRFAVAAHACGFWRPWRTLRAPDIETRAAALLETCALTAVAEAPAGRIAEGERKLLDVAMALALEPMLLLLDEPTSGVSHADKDALMTTLVQALRARSVTGVFVEHDMEVVSRFADRVGVWADGAMVANGAPDDVLKDPSVRSLVL